MSNRLTRIALALAVLFAVAVQVDARIGARGHVALQTLQDVTTTEQAWIDSLYFVTIDTTGAVARKDTLAGNVKDTTNVIEIQGATEIAITLKFVKVVVGSYLNLIPMVSDDGANWKRLSTFSSATSTTGTVDRIVLFNSAVNDTSVVTSATTYNTVANRIQLATARYLCIIDSNGVHSGTDSAVVALIARVEKKK